jgi:hypothetical protein
LPVSIQTGSEDTVKDAPVDKAAVVNMQRWNRGCAAAVLRKIQTGKGKAVHWCTQESKCLDSLYAGALVLVEVVDRGWLVEIVAVVNGRRRRYGAEYCGVCADHDTENMATQSASAPDVTVDTLSRYEMPSPENRATPIPPYGYSTASGAGVPCHVTRGLFGFRNASKRS